MNKKTVTFQNGTTIDIVECYSSNEYTQGAQRETIDFRFDPAAVSMDQVDELFSAANCARLTITETTTAMTQDEDETGKLLFEDVPVLDDAGEPVMDAETGEPLTKQEPVMVEVERTADYIHDNYGVRVALSKRFYTMDFGNGAQDVEQISVKMAQYTPTELNLASLTETVDLLVMESLMG